MSGLDGLDFNDILKSVAGDGVEIGESKVADLDKKENPFVESKKVGRVEVAEITPVVKKKTRASSKTKTSRNDKDYSCAKIKKRYIKLVRILYPDVYVQEGIGKVFEEWEKRNEKKIQEAFSNL